MSLEIQGRHTIDVDSLQRQLTVRQVAAYYGFELSERFSDGGEQRMRCPCVSCTGNLDDRSVSINTSDPFKRWKCHREGYGCGAQGNLVALAYCFKHGAMPPGGKPTGKEFFAIAQDLEAIAEGKSRPTPTVSPDPTVRQDAAAVLELKPNVPLSQSANENARKLVDLDQELVHDLTSLSPAASAYARRRPFLLSEAIFTECRCGYMRHSSKSSLRGQWVYCIRNQQGEPLAWVGRNVRYEDEHAKWVAGGRRDKEPAKYRFPNQSHFLRGLELYGQEFLEDPRFAESMVRFGILLVEGFNDRLRLHELGVMGLAAMSNQLTDEQAKRLVQFARQYGNNRVGIMHDTDVRGDEGAKESLWRLQEAGVDTYLVWSRKKLNGRFAEREPESLTEAEWVEIATGLSNGLQ